MPGESLGELSLLANVLPLLQDRVSGGELLGEEVGEPPLQDRVSGGDDLLGEELGESFLQGGDAPPFLHGVLLFCQGIFFFFFFQLVTTICKKQNILHYKCILYACLFCSSLRLHPLSLYLSSSLSLSLALSLSHTHSISSCPVHYDYIKTRIIK